MLSHPLEQRIARQVSLLRVMGGAFAATGLILMIAAPIGHFTRASTG